MADGRFISYLRVSTQRQGQSGLGIEAQRAAVTQFLNGGNWTLVMEVVEIESGKRNDRPKLAEAFAMCRAYGATLVIARLDRLSRDAAFLMTLKNSDVDFVATDLPTADRTTVGFMSVMAQSVREGISKNTKTALAAAKARGQQLGAYRDGVFVGRIGTAEDCAKATAARSAKAQVRAGHVGFALKHIDPDGTMSLAALARRLNEERVPTPSGKGLWAAMTVKRLRERLEASA
jgi:DNA invertase Pin-like site-specific DNA recombinase